MVDETRVEQTRQDQDEPLEVARAALDASIRATETVAHVARAVGRELELAAMLDAILEQMTSTLGARVAGVHLADEERRELRLVRHRNLPDTVARRVGRVQFDEPLLVAHAASTRQIQAIEVPSEASSELRLAVELLSRTECGSMVAAPLLARGHLVGTVTFALPEAHRFRPDQLGTLATCADVMAAGIANALAFERERHLRGLFEAFSRAAVAVSNEVELQNILQTIVDQARVVARAECAAFAIAPTPAHPSQAWTFSGLSPENAASIMRFPPVIATLGARACGEGRAVRVPDLRRHPAFGRFPLLEPPVTSFLGVPIRHEGRSVGNLYLGGKQGAEEFSIEDERVIELFAVYAGAAVHQAHLRMAIDAERGRFRAILENSPGGMLFIEPESGLLIANARAQELAGLRVGPGVTIDDHRGEFRRPDGAILPKEEWPHCRALRGEKVMAEELVLVRPDGRECPVLLSAAQVPGPTGRMQGVVVVYQDLGTVKELEKLREVWGAIIAHDLRQPLNVIAMSVGLVRRLIERGTEVDLDRASRALERAHTASSSLDRMISDLLDVSRIETMRLAIEHKPMEFPALVRRVAEQMQPLAEGRAISVKVHGRVPTIPADPVRIEQVVSNLLGNAIKYADPETEIGIEVERVREEVHASVANRGPGIPADELPRVFDRYYRTVRVRAGRARGLGLGLYISRGLIEAHGGRIWAESVPGEVTKFHFTLPIAGRVTTS